MLKKGTISKVREYYLEHYKDEHIFLNALREFFDRPDLDRGGGLEATPEEENLFMEWLFFNYKLKNGKTMLEDFYKNNPFNLSNQDLSIYKDLQENTYGFYQVKKVDVGEGMILKNLQTEREYYVNEFQGTLNIEKESIITGRIGKVGDHHELVGSDSLILPIHFSKEFLKSFRIKDQLTPKIIWEIIFKNRPHFA